MKISSKIDHYDLNTAIQKYVLGWSKREIRDYDNDSYRWDERWSSDIHTVVNLLKELKFTSINMYFAQNVWHVEIAKHFPKYNYSRGKDEYLSRAICFALLESKGVKIKYSKK